MKRFALCTIVATALAVPRPTTAQSCAAGARSTCLRDFGGGWLSRILVDYCGRVRIILCDAAF